MSKTHEEHVTDASRYLGSDAPTAVLTAEVRLRESRPFRSVASGATLTAADRAQHKSDVQVVEGWLASRQEPYMGADPMGDE